MAREIKLNWAGLFAGAIGLYVTVWLFTIDVWMLRLWKISSPEFKHSIISVWKYPSPSYFNLETEAFSTYISFLQPSQSPPYF